MRGISRKVSIVVVTAAGVLALMIGTNFIAKGAEGDNINVETNQNNSSNNGDYLTGKSSITLSTPEELEVESVTGRSVSLKWKLMEGFTPTVTYEVYESGNLVAETKTPFYYAEDLVAGRKYDFGIRARQGDRVSEPTKTTQVTTYGEIVRNGNFLELEEDMSGVEFWHTDQDLAKSSLKRVNSSVEGESDVLSIHLSGSTRGKTVILSQDARVEGKQFYIGSGKARVDSATYTGKLNWELQFLDESGDVLMESEWTDHVTGETPEGTAAVRVQLVMEEKRDEEPMTVYVEPVSVSIEPEIHDTAKLNSLTASPVTYRYQYDVNGRLTLVEMDQGAIQYHYDAKGNLIEKIKK
ncbi:fibronectin type III domain-containing protein [Paenibacillus sp. FSL K6-1558]|uniref:fibronectin type III domain-containing protein n=1 Tax=Paenibacillus sp. FSL K6-1558 TaxID=2921473 RepID=UPI0030F5DB8B